MNLSTTRKTVSLALGLFMLAGASQALAGGKAVSRVCYTSAYAWAAASPYYDSDSESRSSCRRSDAHAYANNGSGDWGEACVWARTWGRTGGWAKRGGGGSAGPENPFPSARFVPGHDQGWASVELDPVLVDGVLILTGEMAYSVNGFLEVAVIDATDRQGSMLGEFPSVEAARQAGVITPERVLGQWRETDLAGQMLPEGAVAFEPTIATPRSIEMLAQGQFSLAIDLGGRRPQDVEISVVVHAAGKDGYRHPADADANGVVNLQDLAGFQNALAAGDPSADQNRDGKLDARDYVSFLDAYRTGQR